MRTEDVIRVAAPPDRVFPVAADVEGWPAILPHYRYVRFLERRPDGGVVEMSAYRHFGPFGWPTWWVSEMQALPERHEVQYRHIRGITARMDVVWRVTPDGNGSRIQIVHDWAGPRWPLIGRFAANAVIGPVFIHHIASRTLAGVKRRVESA